MVSKDMRPDAGRRKFLFGSAAAVASLAGIESAIAGMRSDKSVHVVIIGSGAAGMAIANRLNRALPKGKLTVIDPRAPSYYWPGLTLVATGLWPESKTLIDTADYMPARAEWVKESVKVIDAANNSVQTDTGRNIAYDYLVVAPGVEYDYAAIEGMDEKAIGTNGLASVYHSPAKATASWTAIHKFVNEGGQGIYTMPSTPIRCAGAPLKMTFLTLDRIKQAGTQAKAKIDFHSALGNVFSLPFFSDYTINRWKEDGVPTHLKSDLKAVDLGARKARFATGQGDVELTYDLLHVVPPMRAPAFVRDSELSWKEGNFAEGGWLAVDQGTLQHMDFKNVFAVRRCQWHPARQDRGDRQVERAAGRGQPAFGHRRQGARADLQRLHLLPAVDQVRLGHAGRVRLRGQSHADLLLHRPEERILVRLGDERADAQTHLPENA